MLVELEGDLLLQHLSTDRFLVYYICEDFVDLRKYICLIVFCINSTYEIRSFVMNFNRGAVCFGCVVDSGYGLGGSLGDRRPASQKVGNG